MNDAIYLDYNATSPMHPVVREAMLELMGTPNNPSSVHQFGRAARQYVEKARQIIAEYVSAFPNEVIFMGSGTEANNTAMSLSGRPFLVAADSHSSMLPALSAKDMAIPLKSDGQIDSAALHGLLQQYPSALISILLVNNETGIIQQIEPIAALKREFPEMLLHIDAVQALGKIAVDMSLLRADYLTIAPHKIGGPVGSAALIVAQGKPYEALLLGGGQESRRRASTENVPAIAGFAATLQLETDYSQLAQWRDAFEVAVKRVSSDAVIIGQQQYRVSNTSCIIMPGVSNEVQLMQFDLSGVAVSAGSACSSGRVEASHVLQAMHIDANMASGAIRYSSGWNSSESDYKKAAEIWETIFTSQKARAAA